MKRYTLLCTLSMVFACGGDDDSATGSDPTNGMGTETDASSTGNTTDEPTTTSMPTTNDPTTDPTSDPDTGETGDSDDDTSGGSTETGDDTEDALSFAEIWPIIEQNCGCHDSANHPSGLTMPDEDTAYANLVGVTSSQAAPLALVEPASAADSYLWHKVNGTHLEVGGSQDRMPKNQAALPALQVDRIAQWIDDGAES